MNDFVCYGYSNFLIQLASIFLYVPVTSCNRADNSACARTRLAK